MDGKQKLEELMAAVEQAKFGNSFNITFDEIRSISDAYKAMEERAEKAEAALAIARPAILEEAAVEAALQVMRSANTPRRTRNLGLKRETHCVEYSREVSAALLALAHTTGQEG